MDDAEGGSFRKPHAAANGAEDAVRPGNGRAHPTPAEGHRLIAGMFAVAPVPFATVPVPLARGHTPLADAAEASGPATELVDDELWAFASSFLERAGRGRGRPALAPRRVFEGIVFIAAGSLSWRHLPAGFGKWNSVYRQFDRWSRAGVFDAMRADLVATRKRAFARRETAVLDLIRLLSERPRRPALRPLSQR